MALHCGRQCGAAGTWGVPSPAQPSHPAGTQPGHGGLAELPGLLGMAEQPLPPQCLLLAEEQPWAACPQCGELWGGGVWGDRGTWLALAAILDRGAAVTPSLLAAMAMPFSPVTRYSESPGNLIRLQ